MWIRYDEDLLDDPEIWKLEKRNPRWTRLWLDLAILARKADADGEILFHLSGNPWDIESLARRRSVSVKMYRKFVAAAMELGLLEMNGTTLVFPDQYAFLWRASDAMSGAERTRNCRERKKANAASEETPSVTEIVTSDVTPERYTALQTVTECNGLTEPEQRPDRSLQKHGTQNQTVSDLGSLDLKGPIQEFGEETFFAHIAPAYEHFVGKAWTSADKALALQCLQQPWANQQPNWQIRYYAFVSALQHMATARDVKNPWAYALSMVHKYIFAAEEFVLSNARLRRLAKPPQAWKFQRLSPDEDCYGPDYELRGDEPEESEDWDDMEIAV